MNDHETVVSVPPSHRRKRWLLLPLSLLAAVAGWHSYKPLPAGLDFSGPFRATDDLRFLRDITYTHADGTRRCDQQIFDEIIRMIQKAESLLVIDMFLFNAFSGKEDQIYRSLSTELTDAIIRRKQENPALRCWFITDPINTWYGGLAADHLDRLRASGVHLVTTRLSALRDSNPAYSVWWRVLLRFWPYRVGPRLPNPVAGGGVPLRSYFDLFNFKANHRKTVIADCKGVPTALVTSANPHDASSAHHNVAVRFSGEAVNDLLSTEAAVCRLSGAPAPPAFIPPPAQFVAGASLRILTERSVERAVIALLERAQKGDRLTLAMFYLSSRPVVRALKRASSRGVDMRVLLDPNKDAFGREKNGIPNRSVAAELTKADIPVRWVQTHGEQFHTKLLVLEPATGELSAILGSSNYTRRNLHNYNIETSVEVRVPRDAAVANSIRDYLDLVWRTEPDPVISGDYDTYADRSRWRRLLYRFQEATGLSTF
jgi:phosphatidylserine/phosphatidylglycerophosphate/cardiolipin synthase-like enzyme